MGKLCWALKLLRPLEGNDGSQWSNETSHCYPAISDPDRIARLMWAVNAPPEGRVPEVGRRPRVTSPADSGVSVEVIVVDITEAALADAERTRVAHVTRGGYAAR
jgi:hypothetical protein